MVSRNEIAVILLAEVNRKKTAYQLAHAEFQCIAADKPSGLPTPDGTDRLIDAGKMYRFTMNDYDQVLREYNNFILTWILPERFKRFRGR
jgi:hypothetical protein